MNTLTLVIIIGVAIVIGLSLFKNMSLGLKVNGVTPQQAQALIQEGAFLLDVRSHNEFASAHLKGARLIPVTELGGRIGELPGKDASIVVYCHVGSRSAQACGLLSKQGFTKLYNLSGGITAWQGQGLAVVR